MPVDDVASSERSPAVVVEHVVRALGLRIADDDFAYGEIEGSPCALRILGDDPLSAMLMFRVREEHGSPVFERPPQLRALGDEGIAKVEFDEGQGWFTFYDLRGWTGAEVAGLMRECALELQRADLAVGPNCLACGGEPTGDVLLDPELRFVEGRVTRLCADCVGNLEEQRGLAEADLNRSRPLARLLLPLVLVAIVACWAGMLFLSNHLLVFVPLVDLVGTTLAGGALGYVAGSTLRDAGVMHLGRVPVGIVTAILVVVFGAIVWATFEVWWQIGIVAPGLACQMLVLNVQQFGPGPFLFRLVPGVLFAATCAEAGRPRSVGLAV
jgi:hypothetical protein